MRAWTFPNNGREQFNELVFISGISDIKRAEMAINGTRVYSCRHTVGRWSAEREEASLGTKRHKYGKSLKQHGMQPIVCYNSDIILMQSKFLCLQENTFVLDSQKNGWYLNAWLKMDFAQLNWNPHSWKYLKQLVCHDSSIHIHFSQLKGISSSYLFELFMEKYRGRSHENIKTLSIKPARLISCDGRRREDENLPIRLMSSFEKYDSER